MKTCLSCAHCGVDPTAPGDSRCRRGPGSADPVTGASRHVLCSTERRHEDPELCGPQAKFWQSRHPEGSARVRLVHTAAPQMAARPLAGT